MNVERVATEAKNGGFDNWHTHPLQSSIVSSEEQNNPKDDCHKTQNNLHDHCYQHFDVDTSVYSCTLLCQFMRRDIYDFPKTVLYTLNRLDALNVAVTGPGTLDCVC